MNKTSVAQQAKNASLLPSVQGMLQRKCACGNLTVAGAECAECAKKKGRLQHKLSIGASNDPLEQEADRVADQVMAAPAHSAVSGAHPRIQRYSGQAAEGSESAPASVDRVLAGPGRPLEPVLRQDMEQRFGYDFSSVRTHTDAAAGQSARDVNALAYTVGHNIVFSTGLYSPNTPVGSRLLAHELTHVVQQSGADSIRSGQNDGKRVLSPDNIDNTSKREAGSNAEGRRIAGRTPALMRKAAGETTVTVEAPRSPPGCRPEQHRKIEPAVRGAQKRLRLVLERVDAYISAPANEANKVVRAALDRHFHSTSPAVASRVRARLATIRTDMTSRDPFTVECHGATDTQCGNAGAYVEDTNLLVFCPAFFRNSTDWRIGALIHEMAHALTGLDISDRAYHNDRLLPYLSTAEALDNAESYAMFASEVESGRKERGSPPRDEIDDCSGRTQPLIKEAIAHAQRWNRDAETIANDQSPDMLESSAPLFTTHLGDATPATRSAARSVFSSLYKRLKSSIDVRCDNNTEPECSSTRRAYKATASNVGRGLRTGAGIGGVLGLGFGLGAGLGAVIGGAGLLAGLGLFGLIGLAGLALGSVVGLIAGAVTRHPEVHVCPNWAALPTVEDRTESLLAAIYESYADLDAQNSRRYAAFAREVHATWWGAPPPV